MKHSITVTIVLILCFGDVRTIDEIIGRPKLLPCGATFRCSLQEDPVWATDGIRCYVFLNPCYLALENCNRERKHQTALEVVPKEKCQPLCDSKCPECDKPVCGIYNGTLFNFAGLCWMDYTTCMTGQIYTLNNEGPCKRG